jgi:hypothetical protein
MAHGGKQQQQRDYWDGMKKTCPAVVSGPNAALFLHGGHHSGVSTMKTAKRFKPGH